MVLMAGAEGERKDTTTKSISGTGRGGGDGGAERASLPPSGGRVPVLMGSRGEQAGPYRKRAAGRRLQVTRRANYCSRILAGRRLASGVAPGHRLRRPAAQTAARRASGDRPDPR